MNTNKNTKGNSKMKTYEAINRYLAKHELIHLPVTMSGTNTKITMTFANLNDYYAVKNALGQAKIIMQGMYIDSTGILEETNITMNIVKEMI